MNFDIAVLKVGRLGEYSNGLGEGIPQTGTFVLQLTFQIFLNYVL